MPQKLDPTFFRTPIALETLSEENPRTWKTSSGEKIPLVSGVPVLLPDARLAMAELKMRALALIQHYEKNVSDLKADLKDTSLLALTRQRLEQTRDVQIHHLEFLKNLLDPLKPSSKSTGLPLPEFGYSLPVSQALQGYFPNLVRDWSSNSKENELQFEIVKSLIGDSRPSTIAVLGSGGGRLGYDIHQATSATTTYCCDLSAVLTFAAQRISSGETLKIAEFPVAPKNIKAAPGAIRECRAQKPSREGLVHVIADVYYLPFADESVDLIVTPWLVDILPHKLDFIVSEINRVLKSGGRWINSGSFNFRFSDWKECFSSEEALQKIEESGFKKDSLQQDLLPYLHSDLEAHLRSELITSFAVTKVKSQSNQLPAPVKPDWLLDPEVPVPHTGNVPATFAIFESQAFVLSAVDGQRTLLDIANLVHQRYGLSQEDAWNAVANFLSRMSENSVFKNGTGTP